MNNDEIEQMVFENYHEAKMRFMRCSGGKRVTSEVYTGICYGYEYDESGVFVPEAMVVLLLYRALNKTSATLPRVANRRQLAIHDEPAKRSDSCCGMRNIPVKCGCKRQSRRR